MFVVSLTWEGRLRYYFGVIKRHKVVNGTNLKRGICICQESFGYSSQNSFKLASGEKRGFLNHVTLILRWVQHNSSNTIKALFPSSLGFSWFHS